MKELINLIKGFLLIVWQLPQELLGYLFSKIWLRFGEESFTPEVIRILETFQNRKICIITNGSYLKNKFLKLFCGVSLGRYICLTDYGIANTILHENGHCKQSEMLGWLYLPTVGIYSSVFCNLWDRLFHKNWCFYDRQYWYYKTRITERDADKRGGLNRDKLLQKIDRPDNARYPLTLK